jgi:hypothetical protein
MEMLYSYILMIWARSLANNVLYSMRLGGALFLYAGGYSFPSLFSCGTLREKLCDYILGALRPRGEPN